MKNEFTISNRLLSQLKQQPFFSTRTDYITGEKYYNIRDAKQLEQSQNVLYELNSLLLNNPFPVALVGNNTVYVLKNSDLLILENITPHKFNDILIQPHKLDNEFSLSFKTVEFHSYLSLKELSSNKVLHFGIGPKVQGEWGGYAYMRNESTYEERYFKKHLEKHETEITHLTDWASTEVTFFINNASAKHLVNDYLEPLRQKMHNNEIPFNLFLKNCHLFSTEIFQYLFKTNISYAHYLQIDRSDLNDKGQYFNFLQSTSITTLIKNPSLISGVLSNLLSQQTFDQFLNSLHLNWFSSFFSDLFNSKSFCDRLISDTDRSASTAYQNNIMHFAAYKNCPIIFKVLESSKYVNEQNFFGDTPLHYAAQTGNVEFSINLLSHSAYVDIPNKQGLTPLHLAIKHISNNTIKTAIVSELINHGADINLKDLKGDCVSLFEAARSQNLEFFNLILNKADVNCINREGFNVAHIAAEEKLSNIFNYLKENYPNLLNVKSKTGYTAQAIYDNLDSWQQNPRYELTKLDFCQIFDEC